MAKSSKGQSGIIAKAIANLPKQDQGGKKPSVGDLLGGLFPSKPSPSKPNPAIEGIFPSNPNPQVGSILEGLFPSNPNPPNLNVGSAVGNVIKPALPSEPKRDYIDPSLIPRRGINPPRKLPPGIIRFNPPQYEDPLDMGGRMHRLKEKYGNQSPWEKVRRFLGKK
jgi:hypothetical protein